MMPAIVIKPKLIAAAIHGVISAIALTLIVLWVFYVWFPESFYNMLKVDRFFMVVVAVDFCLGPLITLVIYNQRKTKKELLSDYIIIGVLQVGALLYGLYTLAESRPVYAVFVKDRIEITVAGEFDIDRLQNATLTEYSSLPWFGPKVICSNRPDSPEKTTELLFSGYDVQHLPEYYRPCDSGELVEKGYGIEQLLSIVDARYKTMPDLVEALDVTKALVIEANKKDGVVWLPVTHRFGAWVALIDKENGSILKYLDINPFS